MIINDNIQIALNETLPTHHDFPAISKARILRPWKTGIMIKNTRNKKQMKNTTVWITIPVNKTQKQAIIRKVSKIYFQSIKDQRRSLQIIQLITMFLNHITYMLSKYGWIQIWCSSECLRKHGIQHCPSTRWKSVKMLMYFWALPRQTIAAWYPVKPIQQTMPGLEGRMVFWLL